MCGIAGSLSRPQLSADALKQITESMCEAIAHRGPDAQAAWVDAREGIALGHRRLAIVDLSPAGLQPMASPCGRYTLVFNGEIYNHNELRARFEGHVWRGHSDTESMLACFSRYGVRATLDLLVGMFAIAVWDHERRRLILARDRMGEKPLYWGRLASGELLFGSELKALRAHPMWRADIDRDALALYMRHNAIPAPFTVYQRIHKLEPGCWLDVGVDTEPVIERYWSLESHAAQARGNMSTLDDAAATDALEGLLDQALAGQMLADVPLGAFLSGGVDSSTIVALMARRSASPVRTFSIGFEEPGFNEAEHAKAVAKHLGTNHTELYVTAQQARDLIPRLPHVYDEPFADSSQLPTLLVAQMARRHVTVALSGDAGDELFAGYNRYLLANRVWRQMARVPLPLRRLAASATLAISPAMWTGLGRWAAPGHANLGDKLHKLATSVLPVASRSEMYRALVSHWQQPEALVLGSTEPRTALQRLALEGPGLDATEQMTLLDQITYLPDDILVKVDRAAMAHSLETRVPLLDHRIVEFALRVPMHQKLRQGPLGVESKWLLRQVLYRYVPREMIERPKQGFSIPLDQWLRGPLRDWAEHLLDESRLRQQGLLDATTVQRTWREHLSGRRNWQYQLWDVLMLQSWLEAQQP
ncbi:asparagine synthase (glutamine-hydrolyzing) [Roseateles sp.]|uniref:asparagine synthase (glutamine-hydrolyzing) n=1 Tax=Roseateles sp. TaxID=1971397 RepID=UPI003BA9B6C7